jgi:hypothetical protein
LFEMIGAPLPAGSCKVCDEPPGLLDVAQPGFTAPVVALPDGADPLGAAGFAAGADGGAAVPLEVALCAAAVMIAPLINTSDSATPMLFAAMMRSCFRVHANGQRARRAGRSGEMRRSAPEQTTGLTFGKGTRAMFRARRANRAARLRVIPRHAPSANRPERYWTNVVDFAGFSPRQQRIGRRASVPFSARVFLLQTSVSSTYVGAHLEQRAPVSFRAACAIPWQVTGGRFIEIPPPLQCLVPV